jgi:hypothetical protein
MAKVCCILYIKLLSSSLNLVQLDDLRSRVIVVLRTVSYKKKHFLHSFSFVLLRHHIAACKHQHFSPIDRVIYWATRCKVKIAVISVDNFRYSLCFILFFLFLLLKSKKKNIFFQLLGKLFSSSS